MEKQEGLLYKKIRALRKDWQVYIHEQLEVFLEVLDEAKKDFPFKVKRISPTEFNIKFSPFKDGKLTNEMWLLWEWFEKWFGEG